MTVTPNDCHTFASAVIGGDSGDEKGGGFGWEIAVNVYDVLSQLHSLRTSVVGTANAARPRARMIIVFAIRPAAISERGLSARDERAGWQLGCQCGAHRRKEQLTAAQQHKLRCCKAASGGWAGHGTTSTDAVRWQGRTA